MEDKNLLSGCNFVKKRSSNYPTMKIFLSVFLVLFFFACDNTVSKQKKQIEQLKEKVIAIHDEVMPKDADISRVRRKLKAIAKDTTLTPVQQEKITVQITELTKATEAMGTWMAEYNAPKADDSFEESMKMLNEEKEKIIKVKDLMLSSLESGQKLVDELNVEKEQ